MSWSPFDAEPGRAEAGASPRAELVRAVFGTPAGRALLGLWRAELETPAWRPGEALDQVAHREGRRDLVREIIRQTETGES